MSVSKGHKAYYLTGKKFGNTWVLRLGPKKDKKIEYVKMIRVEGKGKAWSGTHMYVLLKKYPQMLYDIHTHKDNLGGHDPTKVCSTGIRCVIYSTDKKDINESKL
jgi:hypothetical protein